MAPADVDAPDDAQVTLTRADEGCRTPDWAGQFGRRGRQR